MSSVDTVWPLGGVLERLTTYAASYSLELTSQPHIWYNVSHAGGILGIGFLRVRPDLGGWRTVAWDSSDRPEPFL